MDYEKIITDAHAAADKAILDYYAAGNREGGINCGFAWVKLDGRAGLARYCRSKLPDRRAIEDRDLWLRYGSSSENGWQWWGPGEWPTLKQVKAVCPDFDDRIYTQDKDFKYVAAKAFVLVLNEAGIGADARCRFD